MNNIKALPPAFLKARLTLINRELDQLPRIQIGRHGADEVIRAYSFSSDHRTHNEYKLTSKKGQLLMSKYELREKLLSIRKQIEAVLPPSYTAPDLNPQLHKPLFGVDFWNSLKPQSNNYQSKSVYEYKNIKMRSRGEVIIAQVLDSLGLMYKYEPIIRIGDEYYSPDFVVWLPELRRCFIIEFMGRLDDDDYLTDNLPKLGAYLKSGMIINKDLILFCGYENRMVSPDEVLDDLVALIKKLCRMYAVS